MGAGKETVGRALLRAGIVAGSGQFTPGAVVLSGGQSDTVILSASDMSYILPGEYTFAVTAQAQSCSSKKDQNNWNIQKTSMNKGHQDIVDTAVAAGQFSTLAAALEAGGLINTL